jgi:hypothetical protein
MSDFSRIVECGKYHYVRCQECPLNIHPDCMIFKRSPSEMLACDAAMGVQRIIDEVRRLRK